MSPLRLLFLIPKRYRLAFFDYIFIPLVQPFSWLISGLGKALFSRHRARSSLAKEKGLELEIRTEFSFLFESRAAAVVPNIGVPFPEPFDFATVTVATGNLLLRIVSGLDNLTISLARAVEPNVWYDLRRVLAAVEGSVYPRQPTSYSMSEWGVLIRDNLDRLNTDFGTLHVQVQRRLMEFEHLERASIREWEERTNNRLP
jgi:hypothetical protein